MKLLFVGDCFLGNESPRVSDPVRDYLGGIDALVANFEGVISDAVEGRRKDKQSILTTRPDVVEKFVGSLNCDVIFSLANNHISDLGAKGVEETQSVLSDLGIPHFGVGLKSPHTSPTQLRFGNKNVSMIAVSSAAPEVMARGATATVPGVVDYITEPLQDVIQSGSRSSDLTVVLPHWGVEYTTIPSYSQRMVAWSWLESGADFVIGHHPHLIHGEEKKGANAIFYSLGNFVFPSFEMTTGIVKNWEERSNYSYGVEIDLATKSYNIVGFHFNQDSRSLEISNRALQMKEKASEPLQFVDAKKYNKAWESEVYGLLKKKRSFVHRVVSSLKAQHATEPRLKFLAARLTKKFGLS